MRRRPQLGDPRVRRRSVSGELSRPARPVLWLRRPPHAAPYRRGEGVVRWRRKQSSSSAVASTRPPSSRSPRTRASPPTRSASATASATRPNSPPPPASPRELGVAEHVIAEVDLSVFGGSALTATIDVPKERSDAEMAQGIPITYVPARNTIFLSIALAWAEVLEADDIFVGVNALDYSGYPDCRPEYIQRLRADGEPRDQGRRRRPAADPDPRAADRADARPRSSSAASSSASTTRSPTVATTPTPTGAPAAAATPACCAIKGFREAGVADPTRYQERFEVGRMTYTVKEIFYTLQGEGAHTGRPAVFCRFSGCNLWTGREEDRANAICTFCDTDFVGVGPDGGKFRHARRPRRRGRQPLAVAERARQALRRLHRRRTAAATRRRRDRRLPRARLRGRDRDQRHPRAAARASTGSASARRPAPRPSCGAATN